VSDPYQIGFSPDQRWFVIFRTHDLRRMAQALSPRRRRPA